MGEREGDLMPKGKFGFRQKHNSSEVRRQKAGNIVKNEGEWCGAQGASFGVNTPGFLQFTVTRWIK